MLISVDDSMSIYLFVVSRHWTLIVWTLAACMIGSFVLSEGGCSVLVVTFMSRDFWNDVLCRVRHLVNRFVVFLESRVFSSLAKLL